MQNFDPKTRNIRRDTMSIRDQLRATESISDELLLSSAELMKRMITARRNPDVAPHVGQAALIKLTRAQQHLIDGSSDLFRVHDELNKVGLTVGVMDEEGTTPTSGLSANEPAQAAIVSADD